ncbi:MAG: universal stress protein [Deltaproteobacteria bacterium]|nr:universal stress protein [Deltaproteobacteria bacterium]
MYSKILVPLDGSKTAELVLPHARALARKFNLPIELLCVIDIAEVAAHLSAVNARYMDAMVEAELKNCRSYLDGIVKSLDNLPTACAVEKGRADEVIFQKAAADTRTLIAMATHGRSGLNRWLLGSVAEKVLRATENPLFLVRVNEATAFGDVQSLKSILVPLDGSELAESALPHAAEIAKKLNLEIILLRTFELPVSAFYGTEEYFPKYEELRARTREEAGTYIDGKVAGLKARGLQRVSGTVVEGEAGEKIIEIARGHADTMVAMCTHGRSGVRRWMLGSVTEKVVRHCGDPVLVISAKAQPRRSERGVFTKFDDKVGEAMKYTID